MFHNCVCKCIRSFSASRITSMVIGRYSLSDDALLRSFKGAFVGAGGGNPISQASLITLHPYNSANSLAFVAHSVPTIENVVQNHTFSTLIFLSHSCKTHHILLTIHVKQHQSTSNAFAHQSFSPSHKVAA